jgi:hypothetical protein
MYSFVLKKYKAYKRYATFDKPLTPLKSKPFFPIVSVLFRQWVPGDGSCRKISTFLSLANAFTLEDHQSTYLTKLEEKKSLDDNAMHVDHIPYFNVVAT